ncbi:MAG: ABC transporter permease [Thiothrix sp.]|nr:MAG: ABC transporter permease [Thiothrix sp.]
MALFAKQQYLIDFTLSSLLRRKGKNLALLIVYTLIVFMLASVMLFTHSLRKEAGIILQQSPEIIVQKMVAGRHDLMPADYLEKLGRLRGVTAQRGRLWGYFYDPAVEANYTLMATDEKGLADAGAEHTQRGEVAIGAGIARARGIGVGDFFSFFSPAQQKPFIFKVKEILSNESELVSADLILMSEKSYQSFFGIAEGFYTDLVLSVRNPKEVQKVAQKIAIKLPDTRPILREEILRTYDSIFSWRQGIVFVLLMGAVLAFVIFAWDKASGLSAEEKREIGILKAIGWETDDILRMKFWEGAIMSLAAFFIGYLLAYAHVFYGSASLFEPVLKGWAVLYPDFRPTPYVDGLQVATLFFFTVFPYTVATVIPIWRAAITDPDAVMR